MSTITVQAYRPIDLAKLIHLWSVAIGSEFPIQEYVLRRVLQDDGTVRDTVIARCAWDADVLVGFCFLTSRDRGITASRHMRLQAVVVKPEYRRRGLGSRLAMGVHDVGRDAGAVSAEVGGGRDYLWPAIPEALDGATDFISAIGYQLGGVSYDLRSSTHTPERARDAAGALQHLAVTVEPASGPTVGVLLQFVADAFDVEWHLDLLDFLKDGGRTQDLLIAFDSSRRPVGFSRIHTQGSAPIGPPMYWRECLSGAAGGLGPIGVAPSWRGRGLGSALLGAALCELADGGSTDVVIDFVAADLLDFYGRLGFAPWMAFRHASWTPLG